MPFVAPLQPFALAYNLGNFLRRLALPRAVKHWSLTTLREKLVKIGAKVVTHARYVIFQMAEVAIPRKLFAAILERIQPAPVRRSCGAFRMSPPIAQRRSCSGKPGGSPAPRREGAAFLGLLALQPTLRTDGTGPFQPPEAGRRPEKRIRLRPGCGIMTLDGPAAEPGEVIWEMSDNTQNRPAV